ncbi:hypothetical protein G7Y89_g783 [Cudoniella acicularis]|uniref:Uncharacterized protein n=1 Tax=Cudoniella acicularis TaxID=354080 RepID=A0A8H4WA35_9HELO|nr:hypothetical protein G7Y89_g783 [Cudoniella acicularis]
MDTSNKENIDPRTVGNTTTTQPTVTRPEDERVMPLTTSPNIWVCCRSHIHRDGTIVHNWENRRWIRSCNFPGCGHERCYWCIRPAIETWR